MTKPTVYVETTVIRYRVAAPSRDLIVAAHQQLTRTWWEQALPALEPYVSPFVLDEISRGDSTAARERLDAIATFSVLGAPPEVEDLARRYFDAIAIPAKARIDSFHLATAAWHGMTTSSVGTARTSRARACARSSLESTMHWRSGRRVICTPEELMEV